jgi:hypothetical protein
LSATRLVVCVGSACREAPGHGALIRLVGQEGGGHTIPCQDICRGPVLGIERGGEVRWYAKVRGKPRRRLVRRVARGAPRRLLSDLEVRKRRGIIRRLGHRKSIR